MLSLLDYVQCLNCGVTIQVDQISARPLLLNFTDQVEVFFLTCAWLGELPAWLSFSL